MKSILLGLAILSLSGCAHYGYVYQPQVQAQYQAQQRANYCNQMRAYNPPTTRCTTYGANTTCQTATSPAWANSGC
jgi:hypothetical protein